MQKKFVSFHSSENLIIHVMAPQDEGGYAKLRLPLSAVSYLQEVDADISGLVLVSGEKIPVYMQAAELERKLFDRSFRDSDILDLTELSGDIVRDVRLSKTKRDFNEASAPLPIENVPLTIALFARAAQTQNFMQFIFREDMIRWSLIEGKEDGVNGYFTKFPLVPGYKGPFGEDAVLTDMPRAKFMELYNLAKMNGETILDLREWTRRRDPDNNKLPKR